VARHARERPDLRNVAGAMAARRTRSTQPESFRTVVLALAANLATALAKLAAALFTGSSAMLAEAFHGFADTGNEVLLLVAERRSGVPPDEQHPLGHGRRAYFWALIASLGVFTIGALLSVRQGILDLVAPEPTGSFRVAYVILAIAFFLDSISLVQAHRQLRDEARALNRAFLEHLDVSSDPIARAVFAEDAAALVGNVIAFIGILLHQLTGSSVPEAIAALVIGVLLGFVAFQLAARNGDILIGGQATASLRKRIGASIAAQPGIRTVTELLVTFIGPRRAWVVARVAVDDTLSSAAVQALSGAVEAALQRESPFIARVDIVPRGPTAGPTAT
jgi:cation diffusion facilitator family transporter